MIYFGADVLIMVLVGLACVVATATISYAIPLDDEAGHACIMASLLSVLMMILGYLFIAYFLVFVIGLC